MTVRSKLQGFDTFVSEKENILKQKKRAESFRKPMGTDLLTLVNDKNSATKKIQNDFVISEKYENEDYGEEF